jgi:hypothetical protein
MRIQYPRNPVKRIALSASDLVIRITRDETPDAAITYDVQTYIGGALDFRESEFFMLSEHKCRQLCKELAVKFASEQIAKLL